MDANEFHDKVAIVTGSTRGWGRGAAEALAGSGAAVIVNGTVEETVASVTNAIRDQGGRAVGVVARAETTGGAHQLVSVALEQFGRLDILVNSVGVTRTGALIDLEVADWDQMIAAQMRSVFLCSKYAAQQMIAQGAGGRIVNVAGSAGQFGLPGNSAHAATKGGVLALTYSWADELASHAITVNAVRGAVISAGANRALLGMGRLPGHNPASYDEAAVSADAVKLGYYPGRLAGPLVVWLASAAAAGITGINIGIDGSRIVVYDRTKPSLVAYNVPHWTSADLRVRLQPMLERLPADVGLFAQLWTGDAAADPA